MPVVCSVYCYYNLLHRILRVLCRGLKLSEDLSLTKLAELTPGFVGADLMSLTREAAMHAVSRVLYGLWDGSMNREHDEVREELNQSESKKGLLLGEHSARGGGEVSKGDIPSTASEW